MRIYYEKTKLLREIEQRASTKPTNRLNSFVDRHIGGFTMPQRPDLMFRVEPGPSVRAFLPARPAALRPNERSQGQPPDAGPPAGLHPPRLPVTNRAIDIFHRGRRCSPGRFLRVPSDLLVVIEVPIAW